MTKWHGGKGSGRRKENTKRYEDNWEAIFGKKKKEKKKMPWKCIPKAFRLLNKSESNTVYPNYKVLNSN